MYLISGQQSASSRVHDAGDRVLVRVGLCADRHHANRLTFLRRPRRRDVVNHDTSVVHRRLNGHRFAALWVHVLTATAVDDAIRHGLCAEIQN